MLDIRAIRELCTDNTMIFNTACCERCQERGISMQDITNAILRGEIIEQYPEDYPYPSCLVLGDGPLHVVVGVGQGMIWIVTAYKPGAKKWESDWKTRKAGENP